MLNTSEFRDFGVFQFSIPPIHYYSFLIIQITRKMVGKMVEKIFIEFWG